MINGNFKSIKEIIAAFPDEQSCITHLEELRWGGIVISPFDPNSKVYQCKLNRYRCKNTGKYFNAKTNTLFYNSRIELQKWFIAIWLVTSEEKSVTTIELSNTLSISQKTAWYMLKNIKKYFDIKERVRNKSNDNKKLTAVKKKEMDTEEIEVIRDSDKLQMTEWLNLFKK